MSFVSIDIRADTRAVLRDLRAINSRAVPAATASALNKTAAKARTQVSRRLAATKNIPQKTLKKRLRVFRANRRRLFATVWLGLKSGVKPAELPGIASFTFAGKGAGTIKVGKRRFTGVFRARMPSGHQGLFARAPVTTRRTAGRPRTSSPNLPIVEPQVHLQPEGEQIIRSTVPAVAAAEFRRIFEAEMRFRLRK